MQPICSCVHRAYEAVKQAVSQVLTNPLGLFNLWLHSAWHGKDTVNSNVVVVLTATYDDNGVLSLPQLSNTRQLHSHKEIEIIYRKVSSLEEIDATLTEIKQKNNCIKGLWVHAHGNPRSFCLGKKNPTSTSDVHNYFDHTYFDNRTKLTHALANLDADASIILDSCATGFVSCDGSASIAQTIAELAPHRRVYASTESVNGVGTYFAWKKDSITATFTAPKSSNYSGVLKKIANFFYECMHAYSGGHIGKCTGAVFKSVPQKSASFFNYLGMFKISPIYEIKLGSQD